MKLEKKAKTEMRALTLNQRIQLVGRKNVAATMGMPCSTLYAKLGGYRPLTEIDKRAIETAVSRLERKAAA